MRLGLPFGRGATVAQDHVRCAGAEALEKMSSQQTSDGDPRTERCSNVTGSWRVARFRWIGIVRLAIDLALGVCQHSWQAALPGGPGRFSPSTGSPVVS